MRLHRLRQLTAAEIRWRLGEAWRTAKEGGAALRAPRWNRRDLLRVLAPDALTGNLRSAIEGSRWNDANEALRLQLSARPARYVLGPTSAPRLREAVLSRWPEAARDAEVHAERIFKGEYDLLGYRGLVFSSSDSSGVSETSDLPPLDWHLDPVHQRRAPRTFWARTRYLDPAIGDHKIIWEFNRHQHWFRLGRAFWLTGDPKYAQAIVRELASWLHANPPLMGINWASTLEVGFRSLSWTWAAHCLLGGQQPGVRGQGDTEAWLVDLLVGVDRHLTHIERHLSYYFSPNTHLTGEALALYVVGTAFPELAGSERWVRTGRHILITEIAKQILGDGGHAERSTHYQRYTLDFYLLALLTARLADDSEAAHAFSDAVRRLSNFTRAMADDSGMLPLIGDDDGGMLWPLSGRACRDVRDSLSLAAAVFGRSDLAPWGLTEEAIWIGGPDISGGLEVAAASDTTRVGAALRRPEFTSRLFADTGYFVARSARGDHAVLDVGPHGYLNGGHAHADALAVTLTIEGRPLLIDPGTSTYTMDPALRDRMRATSSHNTVVLDGKPQSQPSGPFHWRSRTDAHVHRSGREEAFDWIEAWHDSYAPEQHRRMLVRTAGDGWLIADTILGSGTHAAAAHWHFDPAWMVACERQGALRATHQDGTTVWLLHDGDTAELFFGDEAMGLGWYAPVYGTLVPTWTARITRTEVAPFSIVTWLGTSDALPSLQRAETIEDGGPLIAARINHNLRTVIVFVQPASDRAPSLLHSHDGKTLPLVHS